MWGGRWTKGAMYSWRCFGKKDLKIQPLRWRQDGSEIRVIWKTPDISQSLQQDSGVCGPQKLRWLVQVTHLAFSRLARDKAAAKSLGLTERELEVMKWTADGKSAQDVADILLVSKHTVDFHIKNSVVKLEAPNKTAAVVRAALLGLLT